MMFDANQGVQIGMDKGHPYSLLINTICLYLYIFQKLFNYSGLEHCIRFYK